MVGFEALVRWQHPRHGILLPSRFLPVAEATGYISDIDAQVIVLALRDLARWQRVADDKPHLWTSVNMSAAGLSSPQISRMLTETLPSSGVDPANVVIEITETSLLEDTPEIGESIGALKRAGLKLALDDFGTAFSSLSYLRRFPFDHVKIDTSFTAQLPHDARAVMLVEAIGELAAHMGATAIAEGIEQPEQAACLIEAGWAYGQGFLYSRAVPFDQANQIAQTRALP